MVRRIQNSPNIKNPCSSCERGFTLTEIIMVLLLVGLLVALAVPMFRETDAGAEQAKVNAAAEALTAVSAKNYALFVSGSSDAFTVNNCTDVPNGLTLGHTVPAGFTINSVSVVTHERVTCTITNGSVSANFVAIGT